jgi:hypothetical protein
MKNRSGALPNDRPHVIHLDGYYRFVWKQHSFSPGISFAGHSGQPITPLGTAPVAGANETFILPRGSAGRTPFVTQLDAHFSYRTKLSQNSSAEAFVDIFNILNRKTALTVDALYTYDQVMPADSGADLSKVPKAKDDGTSAGAPIVRNPNYLRPTSYQLPISGRLGMRIWF